jgi:hypothetical protein
VSASQPDGEVTVEAGCNDFTGDQPAPNGQGATGTEVPIPSRAAVGGSSDQILTVYQPAPDEAWEFWLAQNNGNGTWSACWGGELNMATSDGVFPNPHGETGSGISNLATEITEADVASGLIDHAIAMQVLGTECNCSDSSSDGGLYPADRTDCGAGIAGAPSEGSWFWFPAHLAMSSGLTPFAQMVFKAIQTYGMVVVDQGGAVAIEADQSGYEYQGTVYDGTWELEGNSFSTDPIANSWDGDAPYNLVTRVPWQDLQAVDPPQS